MPDQLDDQFAVIKVLDVSAGQFSEQHPTDALVMPQNAASALINVDIDALGKRKKRKGYDLIANNVGVNKVAGLIGFAPTAGTKILLMESNGVVYTWNGAAGTWTSSITLTAQDIAEFAIGGNLAFRLSQIENVRSFNGSVWADEGNLNTDFPRAKIAFWTSNQRMLAFNTVSEPNGMYYSDTGDPQTWDRTTDLFRIGREGDEGITGAIEFTSGDVVVFTKDNMSSINIQDPTPANWTQAKIADIGCLAFRTLRQMGQDALFLSDDGVRSVVQSAQDKKRGASLPISFPIQDWIDRINFTQVDKATAWVWRDKYYLAVPIDSATENSHVLVWSQRAHAANGGKGGWSIYENIASNAFGQINFGNKPRVYFGDSGTGSVYMFRSSEPSEESDTDNGTNIEYQEISRAYDFGSLEVDKTYEHIEVTAISTSGNLIIDAQIENTGFTRIAEMDLTGFLPQLPIALPFDLGGTVLVREKFDLEQLGRGRYIQIQLTEDTESGDVEILSYSLAAFIENIENND